MSEIHMSKLFESQEQELMAVTDIGDYLNNDVLEIRREQYLTNSGKWVTTSYTLITGLGGPHIEFNTNWNINVYWGGEIYEGVTPEPEARGTVDLIEEALDETFS